MKAHSKRFVKKKIKFFFLKYFYLLCFKDGTRQWKDLSSEEKKDHILRLLNLTEINDKNMRDKAYRAILYIAQGKNKK